MAKRGSGKHCNTCREFKGFEAYNRDARAADGHDRMCRKCRREYNHNHYLSRREMRRAQIARWEREHPGHKAERLRRRAERIKANGGSHSWAEWVAVCDRFGWHCLRCGGQGGPRYLTRDHVIPISKGGSDDISNIQPLCHECNRIKGADSTDYRPRWHVGDQELAADD